MGKAVPIIAALAGIAVTGGLGAALLPWGTLGGLTTGLAGLGLGFTEAGAASFIGAAAGFVVATGLNVVGSRAFAPGNHESSPEATAINSQSHAVMVNTTIGTHKIIYGTARVSGVVEDLGTTDTGPVPHGGPNTGTNLFRHFVVLLAGHEVQEIVTLYLDDKPVTLDANGYANCIPYSYYPDSPVASTQTVSTAVRSSEVVTLTTSAAHGFSAGDAITVAVASDLSMNGDFIVIATPSSTTLTYANGGPNTSATGGSVTDNTISTSVNSYVRIKKHLGEAGQSADPDMVAEIPGWDSDCRLQGLAYVYVRMEYNQDVFSRGVPNVSAIVKGKKCYDPRDASTAWTDNAALCTRDYMISDYGINCPVDEINDDYFSAAANVCDEAVTLTTGGTQKRYTANGVLDTASTRQSNLNALVAAMAGTVTEVQGQYRCHAGAYDATSGDVDTSMLAGNVKVRYRTPRDQLFNAVQGVYVDPSLNYAGTDFPPVTNDTYTAADGDEQIFRDVQLPLTNHPEAAQRIAKVLLEQARQGIQVSLPLQPRAIPYTVWDTITYTDAARGWDHKVFRIKKFSKASMGPIMLSLQEESSAAYDWDSGEATVIDPAPDTNLPNPLARPDVPSGVAFDSRITTGTGSESIYTLGLTWEYHNDAFVVNGGRMELQYKLSSEADWRPSFFVGGDQVASDVTTSSVGVAYDLRIRAITALGNVSSNWVTITGAIVGSSGGVGTTLDWGNWTDAVGPTNDWDNWTDSIGTSNDWGFYT